MNTDSILYVKLDPLTKERVIDRPSKIYRGTGSKASNKKVTGEVS
jgi:hypothetical protein